MAYIKVTGGVPGIRSLIMFSPGSGKVLLDLAQVLLRGPSTLSEAERELIAAYVSHHNTCVYCTNSHAAAARCLYAKEAYIVDEVLKDMETAPVCDKMKALLHIAGKVQVLGKEVHEHDVAAARIHGAVDQEIHDTDLIAAAFCMYNRYVDGLASWTPAEPEVYYALGKRMAEKGYAL